MGKKNKETLGRCLIKDRFSKNRHKRHVEDNSMLHTTEVNDGYDWGRLNLQSVTAESSLQEFLSTAQLADKEFAAEKLNIHYVKSAPSSVPPPTSQPDFSEPLTLPRRPEWLPGVSAEEQANKEKEAFLEWRKHLNELQEKLGAALTPYERNLELWKQLWRTLERSDLVLLLLDARYPQLFRSADLESYASEKKCKCVLLLNKADLITEYQRKCWAEYFEKEGVQVVFFSAAKCEAKPKEIEEESEKSSGESESEDSGNEDLEAIEEESGAKAEDSEAIDEGKGLEETEEDIEVFKKQVQKLEQSVSITADRLNRIQTELTKVIENLRLGHPTQPVNLSSETDPGSSSEPADTGTKVTNSHEVLDREKLLAFLKGHKAELNLKNPPHLTVGMIGYPNVGKSSTVNVLMQTKKVSVSSMPGHTRHVQSLMLDEDVHVLDCPGLVLPAYAVAPDLLLTAVLPIDQMKSHDAAVCRLCELVPRRTMERQYGLLLPTRDTDTPVYKEVLTAHASVCRLCELVSRRTMERQYGLLMPTRDTDTPVYKEVLTAHAYNRGFMTAAGQADVSRSARALLKDAASGRLRWAVPPPDAAPEPAAVEDVGDDDAGRRKPTPRETRLVEGWSTRAAEIDKSFFSAGKGLAHVKGKPIPGLSGVQVAPTQDISAKPWRLEKKHANKNKREKLRRVYSHLDQH